MRGILSDRKGRPETSVIFILRGTGIFLVFFYIHPIVPYASACFAQFLLLVTTLVTTLWYDAL